MGEVDIDFHIPVFTLRPGCREAPLRACGSSLRLSRRSAPRAWHPLPEWNPSRRQREPRDHWTRRVSWWWAGSLRTPCPCASWPCDWSPPAQPARCTRLHSCLNGAAVSPSTSTSHHPAMVTDPGVAVRRGRSISLPRRRRMLCWWATCATLRSWTSWTRYLSCTHRAGGALREETLTVHRAE
jgi:hypothetical protein